MPELKNGLAPPIKSQLNGTVPIVNGRTSYTAKHKIADHFIGGNRLENAVAGPVKDFVTNHDGHTVITNVGVDAGYQRVVLTALAGLDCQQWYCSSQGDPIRAEMGLRDLRR